MSNSLDPDQDQHSVGPYLDSKCLQRLSTEKESYHKQDYMCKFHNLMGCKYVLL